MTNPIYVRVAVTWLLEPNTLPAYCAEFFDGKGPVVFISPQHLEQLTKYNRTLAHDEKSDYEEALADGIIK